MEKIKINDIKLDPRQPRRFKNPDEVRALMDSIKEHGLINPIEVDQDNVLVTGEMRYTACKKLGWKTIPCNRVKDLSPATRLARQITENVARGNMTLEDTARSYAQLLEWAGNDVSKASKMCGVEHQQFRLALHYMGLSSELQEKLARLPFSMLRAVRRVNQKYKASLVDKIIAEKLPRDFADKLATVVNQGEEQAKKALGTDFNEGDGKEKLARLESLFPTPPTGREIARYKQDCYRNVSDAARRLEALLMESFEATGEDTQKEAARFALRNLPQVITKWLELT